MRKVVEAIPKVSLFVAGVAMCLLVILIALEVVTRTVFRYSVDFAIEYAEYLIPVIVLVGAAYVLSKQGHVSVDIVTRKLPERVRTWVTLVGSLLGLGYLIVLDVQTIDLVATSIRLNSTSYFPLRTPLAYPQLVLPIGISLFALQLAIEIIGRVRRL